jgi:hypothetical protein
MNNQAERMIQRALGKAQGEFRHTVELLKPSKTPDPHEPGRTIDDWTNPTVVTSVQGNMQPASLRALEAAGLIGKRNVQQIYCQSLAASPDGRVRVAGVVYVVLSARPWQSHTEMLAEEL